MVTSVPSPFAWSNSGNPLKVPTPLLAGIIIKGVIGCEDETTAMPMQLLHPPVQGWAKYFGQRFTACFVLKLPPQRGEGKKREGVQISNEAHRTFDPSNTSNPVQHSSLSRRFHDRAIHIPGIGTDKDFLEKVKSGKYSAVCQKLTIQKLMHDDFSSGGKCNFYYIANGLFPYAFGMVFQVMI